MTDYTHDIERYLKGEMSAAERHAFEKKALNDPFLAEALEGAETLHADTFADDITELNRKILPQIHQQKSSHNWTWRIAAGLLILSISTYIVWTLSQSIEDRSPIAMENTAKEILPVEEPAPLATDDQDSMSAQDETPTRNTPDAPLVSAEGKTVPEEHKPERKIQLEKDLNAEPFSISKPPDTKPITLQSQPEEVAKTAEAVTPRDVTLSRDMADEARKKQAVSRVSRSDINRTFLITGKVTAAEDGSALPGVNVLIKGTTLGTVTDVNGDYRLTVPDQNTVLIYSFIGMNSHEATVSSQDKLDVQLTADALQLSEIVVTAYALQPETNSLGYAVMADDEKAALPLDLAHPLPGFKEFKQYLEKEVIYPEAAKTLNVEGRVTVEFYIEPDGALTNFTVIRGIGSGCDEELIRLIKEGPIWIPTKKDGVAVRDKARVRLKFTSPK